MQENGHFQCSVLIYGDDDGKPQATTSLLVLGENQQTDRLASYTPKYNLRNDVKSKHLFMLTCFILQSVPLHQSASFREVQNIFKMLHSPVCLRKDPQNPPTTGRALVSTTVPDNFHLKQLKVCFSTRNMSLSSALCKYSGLEKRHYSALFQLIFVIMFQRMESYLSSI